MELKWMDDRKKIKGATLMQLNPKLRINMQLKPKIRINMELKPKKNRWKYNTLEFIIPYAYFCFWFKKNEKRQKNISNVNVLNG